MCKFYLFDSALPLQPLKFALLGGLLLGLQTLAHAQCDPNNNALPKFCLTFENPAVVTGGFEADIYMSGDMPFNVGSSNLVFDFNQHALSATVTPSVLTPYDLAAPTYQSPFVTVVNQGSNNPPTPARASFNFELNFAPGLAISTSGTKLGRFRFTISNSVNTTDFDWQYNGLTTLTVVYLDDNATQICAVTPGCLVDISFFLPLDLLTFRAQANAQKQVDVFWNTANEHDMLGYDVERSADGIKFSYVGHVPAQNGKAQTYRFTDLRPLPGTSYYRLKIRDLTEEDRYTNMEPVRFETQSAVRVYPNPSSKDQALTVETDLVEPFDIILTDMSGKEVLRQHFEDSGIIRLQTQGLPSGMYYYSVRSGTLLKSGKVVIE